MPTKAVQQFMLGTVLGNENEARQTLAAMKAAGYDGIELCGFMIHPIGFMVRLLTKAAGMPVGKGGNLDWHALVKEAGLQVVSLHTDLGSLERDAKAVADEAKSFGTKYVVITGMYRFDYGDEATMHDLAARLNKAGEALKAEGVELLYHNHNCELRHVNAEKRAYDILLEETDPQFVNFEFDSYWFTEGGANALAWMQRLGTRMKLWHINDRGTRISAAAFADQPVAFVVFDNSGNVTQQVYKMWREPVRWAYHFPDFKLVDTDRTKKVTAENIFTGHGKSVVDQSVARKIAEEIPAEALVLVIVHDMYEQMVQGMIWRNEDGSTYVRTVLNADIYVYRKDGDRFSKKRIRENEIKELGNQTAPEETMKWAISKQVNIMENRPVIN